MRLCVRAPHVPDMICPLWFPRTQDALNEAKCDSGLVSGVFGFLRVKGQSLDKAFLTVYSHKK